MREIRASDATRTWARFWDAAIRMALVPRLWAQERNKNADKLESAFLCVMESLGKDRQC